MAGDGDQVPEAMEAEKTFVEERGAIEGAVIWAKHHGAATVWEQSLLAE